MDLNEARRAWQKLHSDWAEVHVEALEARGVCTAKFRAGGEGPTDAELERADSLEAKAEELRGSMDEFTGRYFGD